MIKLIYKIIKKIVFSAFLLYAYNLFVEPLGIIIPINFITVSLLTLLGVPALMMLVFIFCLVY